MIVAALHSVWPGLHRAPRPGWRRSAGPELGTAEAEANDAATSVRKVRERIWKLETGCGEWCRDCPVEREEYDCFQQNAWVMVRSCG